MLTVLELSLMYAIRLSQYSSVRPVVASIYRPFPLSPDRPFADSSYSYRCLSLISSLS
jgi:hypothetical protein